MKNFPQELFIFVKLSPASSLGLLRNYLPGLYIFCFCASSLSTCFSSYRTDLTFRRFFFFNLLSVSQSTRRSLFRQHNKCSTKVTQSCNKTLTISLMLSACSGNFMIKSLYDIKSCFTHVFGHLDGKMFLSKSQVCLFLIIQNYGKL